ncbi:spermidine synthase [Streptomyces sp. Root264]|uniref:spermidine synthase n=1 Tax=Streptomyces sp. Root264 TaxID=1736503 RepID=UPI00070ED5CD|nr:spermidine synthase [Streptomyces sp. Root264]KRD06215.1 spermidine synthase [Streptomyces sp. Root264]
MGLRFEEIDWQPTPMGEISLRRRRHPVSGEDVYEVKLGDEFLMSSLFTAGEIALTELGLAELPDTDGPELDVAVGGLGLGYTAQAALDDPRVRSLTVVEALPEVIDWHRRHLVPLGARLTSDARCRLTHGDFFALAADPVGLDPETPGRLFDAILLDVDHSPRHVLHPRHAALYRPAGLCALAAHLRPDGVFALWSNDPPDEQFMSALSEVFPRTAARVVDFDNARRDGTSTNTVYVARTTPGPPSAGKVPSG